MEFRNALNKLINSIGTKIIFPYVLLTIIIAGIGAFIVTNLVTGTLQERFDNQLLDSGRVVAEIMVDYEQARLAVLRAVAGTEGVPVNFDGSGSYDPDGSIISYIWLFGDGETGYSQTVSHTYSQEGNYTVTLTISDDDSETSTDTTYVIIVDQNPLTDFSVSPTSGMVQLTVTYTDISTSYDGIISWLWDFSSRDVRSIVQSKNLGLSKRKSSRETIISSYPK